MIKNYLVSSAGRSGCHLSVALISSCGKKSVHTHNPFYNPSDLGDPGGQKSAIVLLYRQDLFSAIMSMLVGKRTNQWKSYPNKHIEPFMVNCQGPESEFAHQYNWHKNYIQSCSTVEMYKQNIVLCFEDFVNNFDYLFQALNIKPIKTPLLPEKAPYSYKDIIINVDECHRAFEYLEANYIFSPILKPHNPDLPN